MELQKLGISYQFERSGQLPLDNSRKFSTYNEVKSWWTTVGNFYETQIISIGNILYYFYSLPESANTALDANLETHLHKAYNANLYLRNNTCWLRTEKDIQNYIVRKPRLSNNDRDLNLS